MRVSCRWRLPAFSGEVVLKQSISDVIRADLAGTGRFRLVETGSVPVVEIPAKPELGNWKTRGADAIATGSVTPNADGTVQVRLRLFDTLSQKQLAGFELRAQAGRHPSRCAPAGRPDLRSTHRRARCVLHAHVAYVLKQGKRYQLQIADADGHNAQTVVDSNEAILSPILVAEMVASSPM